MHTLALAGSHMLNLPPFLLTPPRPLPLPQIFWSSSRWRWGWACCVHAVCVVRAGREYKRVTLSGCVLCERFPTPFFFLIVHLETVPFHLRQEKKIIEQHKKIKTVRATDRWELRRDRRTKGKIKTVALEWSSGIESHESVEKEVKQKSNVPHEIPRLL